MTYDELDELILGLTSGDGWAAFQQLLEAEGAASLQNEQDSDDLSEIMRQRGYRAGLAFAFNVREMTKMLKEHSDADV
jgi:hypothetical protein